MRHLRAALIGAAILLILSASLTGRLVPGLGPTIANAASPQPSAGSGDTRSAGEAPGFVGAPLTAVAAVVGLGIVAVVATLAYVRLTGGPGRGTDDDVPAARR